MRRGNRIQLVMLMKISIHSARPWYDPNTHPLPGRLRAFNCGADSKVLRNRRWAEWILTFVRMTRWSVVKFIYRQMRLGG